METKTFRVIGMHCASCEHMVERKLKKQPGVQQASVNRMKEVATLTVTDQFSINSANRVLRGGGYELVSMNESAVPNNVSSPMTKVLLTVIICAVMVGFIWMLTGGATLRNFDPGRLIDNVGPLSAFVLGLIASVSTCLAVTGGLLFAITTNIPNSKKWNFSLSFGIGRLLSYTILGGLLGLIGEKLAISTTVSAVLTIIVSIIMILLGLQLIGIFKVPSFMPKSVANGIEDLTNNPKQTAIGALTFFLPCGFTQALQLFALQTGSLTTSATIMFMFALGTLPVLLFVGSVTKYITPTFRRTAMIIAGIVVIALAVISIPSALTLYSVGSESSVNSPTNNEYVVGAQPATAPSAEVVDGVQQITTTVSGFDYTPDKLTVKAGIPVKWTVNGQGATGCAKSFVAPAFGVKKVLSSSAPTIIEFTPTKKGTFQFTCSMGMAGPGSITVI